MNLIDALLAEHGMIYLLFDQIEAMAGADGGSGSPQADGAAALVSKAVIVHAELEDELLFTALEARMGPAGPLAVMRSEHDEIHRRLEGGADGEAGALQRVLGMIPIAREHFAKEEQVLFQMARQVLSTEELEQLSVRWADERQVAIS
jgi:iron-sulfur cluster repair protein YtfE (RIC family)